MFFNLQEDVAQHTTQQCAGPEFRQRERNVGANATVESASSLSCHLPFSLENRGEIEKPTLCQRALHLCCYRPK